MVYNQIIGTTNKSVDYKNDDDEEKEKVSRVLTPWVYLYDIVLAGRKVSTI